jgi:hypothetical protein
MSVDGEDSGQRAGDDVPEQIPGLAGPAQKLKLPDRVIVGRASVDLDARQEHRVFDVMQVCCCFSMVSRDKSLRQFFSTVIIVCVTPKAAASLGSFRLPSLHECPPLLHPGVVVPAWVSRVPLDGSRSPAPRPLPDNFPTRTGGYVLDDVRLKRDQTDAARVSDRWINQPSRT